MWIFSCRKAPELEDGNQRSQHKAINEKGKNRPFQLNSNYKIHL